MAWFANVLVLKHFRIDASMATSTTIKSEMYLIGPVKGEFTGSKLPFTHNALGMYFYRPKVIRETKHDAAKATTQQLFAYWI